MICGYRLEEIKQCGNCFHREIPLFGCAYQEGKIGMIGVCDRWTHEESDRG